MEKSKNIAVILSGCGYLDGAEIHEATLCLLALSQKGYSYHCFAPNILQHQVVNHLTEEVKKGEKRNVLEESARIARGKVSDLSELKVESFDSLLLPGGFGAALNLSTYALNSKEYLVLKELEEIILAFYSAKKAIGATCISPVILANIFKGKEALKMTLGSDTSNIDQLNQMGMQGESAAVNQVIIDQEHKVYTTPCYMELGNLSEMFKGVVQLVELL